MVESELSGMPRPRRSLIVPMYNEAERIGSTLAAMEASPLVDDVYEILLVDDGSTDDTAGIAEKFAAELGMRNVRVVRSAMNRGKGSAVRAGMLTAQGQTRVFADADLSAGVNDIIACFELVEDTSTDVVYASRAHPDSTITTSQPEHRVVTGRAFNLVLRVLQLTKELDTQCGLKGFTAEAADTLFTAVTIEGFAFDVEVLALARREGLVVRDMPVEWSHVDASRVRPIRDGIAMFRDVVALRRALRRAGPVSLGAGDPGGMSAEKFELMAELEEAHWWFRAKRELISQTVASMELGGVAFDVGCGTGGTLDVLDRHFESVTGAEMDGHAAALAAESRVPRSPVVVARAESLPVADSCIDCLTSLDVVEHLVDDVEALREYARAVEPGGVVVLTVPAYQWAWSRHDEILGHQRRYTLPHLSQVVEAAGLEIVRGTYFHSWLVAPALLVRRTPLQRLVSEDEEEVGYSRPLVNRLLGAVARVERRWLRGHDLRFGLSILLVARKPES